MRNHPVPLFIVVSYALSIGLSLAIGFTGGHESRFISLGYLSMFLPAAAMCITNAATDEKLTIHWHRFPWKYVPVALLLMPAAMHVVMLPTAAFFGNLRWQDWLVPGADGLYHAPASRGWGDLTAAALIGRIAMNAFMGLVVVSILAFFEEIGWRAWLLPRLVNRMGRRRAVVLSAIVWAFWHTPYAVSGIQHIDGVSPALTVLIMPIGIAGAGLVLGWLWLRTESTWIVSLAHGALNNWGQYAFRFLEGPGQNHDWIILAVGGLALVATGSLLLASSRASRQES